MDTSLTAPHLPFAQYRPPFVKGSSAGAHQRLFVERVTPSGVVLGPPSPLPDGRTPSADPAPDKSKGTSPSGSAPTVSTTPQRAAHPMGVGGQQILELEPTSSVSRSEPPQEVRRSSLDVEDLGTIRKLRNLNSGRVVFSKVSSQKRRQWLHSDSLGKVRCPLPCLPIPPHHSRIRTLLAHCLFFGWPIFFLRTLLCANPPE